MHTQKAPHRPALSAGRCFSYEQSVRGTSPCPVSRQDTIARPTASINPRIPRKTARLCRFKSCCPYQKAPPPPPGGTVLFVWAIGSRNFTVSCLKAGHHCAPDRINKPRIQKNGALVQVQVLLPVPKSIAPPSRWDGAFRMSNRFAELHRVLSQGRTPLRARPHQ